jgi:hypothetical protein
MMTEMTGEEGPDWNRGRRCTYWTDDQWARLQGVDGNAQANHFSNVVFIKL